MISSDRPDPAILPWLSILDSIRENFGHGLSTKSGCWAIGPTCTWHANDQKIPCTSRDHESHNFLQDLMVLIMFIFLDEYSKGQFISVNWVHVAELCFLFSIRLGSFFPQNGRALCINLVMIKKLWIDFGSLHLSLDSSRFIICRRTDHDPSRTSDGFWFRPN